MDMGFLGGVAVWFLIGAGIISGSRLAMVRDRELAVVGLVAACALVAYALIGAEDLGFFFARIAFITGTFLGLAEAASRLARERASATPLDRLASRETRSRRAQQSTMARDPGHARTPDPRPLISGCRRSYPTLCPPISHRQCRLRGRPQSRQCFWGLIYSAPEKAPRDGRMETTVALPGAGK